jgi:hypothetical protein
MPFRANEEVSNGYSEATAKLLGRSLDQTRREASKSALADIIDRYGPVVDCYPHWHPLVIAGDSRSSPVTTPGDRCGYRGLDHTVFLRNGFITCPYSGGDNVIASVDEIQALDLTKGIATISAEKIDAQLYHPNAEPILVKCEWDRKLNQDGTIPTALAVPLLLEKELPCWRSAEVAETWKTMAPYILGRPCGSRSSLFINQETGQALKAIWNGLINTGMFGPIRVGSW